MLEGIEKSPFIDNMVATPQMSHPHPIKKHLNSLSEESKYAIRQKVGDKLLRMFYAKQLEEIFDLYDCYDKNDFERVINFAYHNRSSYTPQAYAFWTFLSIAAFLKFKKLPVLSLESYVKNIYAVSYIGLFTYSFCRFRAAKKNYGNIIAMRDDLAIIQTKHEIHSNDVNLINSLRFNEEELY